VAGISARGTGDRFKFTGREYDSITQLYYYRTRYYDARLGRFVSQDPIGFAGGDTNLYRYTFNGATNYTDPSGEATIEYAAVLPRVGIALFILSPFLCSLAHSWANPPTTACGETDWEAVFGQALSAEATAISQAAHDASALVNPAGTVFGGVARSWGHGGFGAGRALAEGFGDLLGAVGNTFFGIIHTLALPFITAYDIGLAAATGAKEDEANAICDGIQLAGFALSVFGPKTPGGLGSRSPEPTLTARAILLRRAQLQPAPRWQLHHRKMQSLWICQARPIRGQAVAVATKRQ
jgi:RHS repeat-associated protein